jgi:hypothetical protein
VLSLVGLYVAAPYSVVPAWEALRTHQEPQWGHTPVGSIGAPAEATEPYLLLVNDYSRWPDRFLPLGHTSIALRRNGEWKVISLMQPATQWGIDDSIHVEELSPYTAWWRRRSDVHVVVGYTTPELADSTWGFVEGQLGRARYELNPLRVTTCATLTATLLRRLGADVPDGLFLPSSVLRAVRGRNGYVPMLPAGQPVAASAYTLPWISPEQEHRHPLKLQAVKVAATQSEAAPGGVSERVAQWVSQLPLRQWAIVPLYGHRMVDPSHLDDPGVLPADVPRHDQLVLPSPRPAP